MADLLPTLIRQGKLPTQLALTRVSRLGLVLTEALTLKKIKLLDVVLEGVSSATKDEGGFDADVALFTGELRLLIPELVAALGSVQERAVAAAPPTLPAGAAADEAAPWDTAPA